MLIEPKIEEVVFGERGMLMGIQSCLEQQCLVSAVTLMFSSIDALAALTRPIDQVETDHVVFRAWADRFLQPARIGCSAQDLWGARCGVLHTYSPEAATAAKYGAQRVYYQWHGGPDAKAKRALPPGSLVVIVEELHAALIDATRVYTAATDTDPELKARLKAHLPSLLCYESYDTILAPMSA